MNLIGDDDPPRAAVVLDELDAAARAMHQGTIRTIAKAGRVRQSSLGRGTSALSRSASRCLEHPRLSEQRSAQNRCTARRVELG